MFYCKNERQSERMLKHRLRRSCKSGGLDTGWWSPTIWLTLVLPVTVSSWPLIPFFSNIQNSQPIRFNIVISVLQTFCLSENEKSEKSTNLRCSYCSSQTMSRFYSYKILLQLSGGTGNGKRLLCSVTRQQLTRGSRDKTVGCCWWLR